MHRCHGTTAWRLDAGAEGWGMITAGPVHFGARSLRSCTRTCLRRRLPPASHRTSPALRTLPRSPFWSSTARLRAAADGLAAQTVPGTLEPPRRPWQSAHGSSQLGKGIAAGLVLLPAKTVLPMPKRVCGVPGVLLLKAGGDLGWPWRREAGGEAVLLLPMPLLLRGKSPGHRHQRHSGGAAPR